MDLPNLPTNPLDALGLGAGDGEAHDEPYELAAGPFINGQLRVVDFGGDETVNGLYCYRVRFKTRIPFAVVFRSLKGHAACLTIKRPGGQEPKLIQGIVSHIDVLGVVPGDRAHGWLLFELAIVPRLWLLTQRTTVRQFHNKTPKEIIETVLSGIGISSKEVKWKIGNKKTLPRIPLIRQTDDDDDDSYPRLPLVYQRDESDYDFFRRVLSEAGIIFLFEHASGTLDKLLPGAGAVASSVGSVADMVGGPVADAVGEVGATTKMFATLTFIDKAGDTPALQEMALVNELAATGLSSLASAVGAEKALKSAASAIGGDKAAGLISVDVVNPAGALPYNDEGASIDKERIVEFRLGDQLRPKNLRIIERNVIASSNWVGVAETKPVKVGVDLDVGLGISPDGPFLQTGAAFRFDVDAPTIPARVLRRHLYLVNPTLPFYKSQEERIQLELERMRADRVQGRGKSDCRALSAGSRFRLADYPADELNVEYIVVSLHCEGSVESPNSGALRAVYTNSFDCIPANVRPLPPLWPRPRLGPEVAEVVSQEGERQTPMLDTNHVGAVKLRYPWDTAEDGAERGNLAYGTESTDAPFIPVVQPWAGPGYGVQSLPREGMHVVTQYLDGQGERPIVEGCIYDEINGLPSPEAIEHHKFSIRTRTIPENGGYSELSFGDHKDNEVVMLRAQRDYESVVLHDFRATVGSNAVEHIGGDANVSVDHDFNTTIGGVERRVVQGDRTEMVEGSFTTDIGGGVEARVGGDASELVGGTRRSFVLGDETVDVGRTRTTTLGDEEITTVGRRQVVTIGDGQQPAECSVSVGGKVEWDAKRIVLAAKEELIFGCGNSFIRLTPNTIEILANSIYAVATEEIELSGKGPTIHIDESIGMGASKIDMQAAGVRLVLADGVVNVENTDPEKPTLPTEALGSKAVPVMCRDESGEPMRNAVYKLEIAGQSIHGKTDGEGWLMMPVIEGVKAGRCEVWKGRPLESHRFVINFQFDEFAAAPDIAGAQHRLRNLRIYDGPISGEIDGPTYDAILALQRKHGLEHTGLLDEATVQKLSELHA